MFNSKFNLFRSAIVIIVKVPKVLHALSLAPYTQTPYFAMQYVMNFRLSILVIDENISDEGESTIVHQTAGCFLIGEAIRMSLLILYVRTPKKWCVLKQETLSKKPTYEITLFSSI